MPHFICQTCTIQFTAAQTATKTIKINPAQIALTGIVKVLAALLLSPLLGFWLGFLMRTPRGRVATAQAWQHLGLVPPAQPDLFG